MSSTTSNEYYPESKEFDKTFVLTMIQDLRRLLIYLPKGIYGKEMFGSYVYNANAKEETIVELNLLGTVMVFYYQIFKEKYPENPNVQETERINAIWEAIGHPENKIPLTQ